MCLCQWMLYAVSGNINFGNAPEQDERLCSETNAVRDFAYR